MEEILKNPVMITSKPEWWNNYSTKEVHLIVFSLWCYLQIQGDYNMILDQVKIKRDYNLRQSDLDYVFDHYKEYRAKYSWIYDHHERVALNKLKEEFA